MLNFSNIVKNILIQQEFLVKCNKNVKFVLLRANNADILYVINLIRNIIILI
jgi:hypothetical protein